MTRNSYCNSGAAAYNGPGPSKLTICGDFLQEQHQCREAQ